MWFPSTWSKPLIAHRWIYLTVSQNGSLSGLKAADSSVVKPERVKDAVLSIEGKLLDMKELNYGYKDMASRMVPWPSSKRSASGCGRTR